MIKVISSENISMTFTACRAQKWKMLTNLKSTSRADLVDAALEIRQHWSFFFLTPKIKRLINWAGFFWMISSFILTELKDDPVIASPGKVDDVSTCSWRHRNGLRGEVTHLGNQSRSLSFRLSKVFSLTWSEKWVINESQLCWAANKIYRSI